ncbi:MAG: Flp family type IVb pilin [Fulvimarina manganoxydans]|uniref:Flp family type IVb pilin n=1 Tax=Fulvimarina manganoxydans TaxID=937218 RepID=UPI0023532D0B|nr:Flp family type IVb pilin [Fulvimarina manganoxydans]MCK5931406.1 Flp family type IVb pilin [Fulvimarina manganoxydans]
MSTHFKRFLKNESGATAIEYALIAGLMAVACITALTTLGGTMSTQFQNISDEISAVQPSGG